MRLNLLALLPIALSSVAATDWRSDSDPGLPGSADGGATVWAARGFDEVAFGGAANVDVRVGPSWSVRATGPAAAIAGMRVRVRDGSLIIDSRPPYREGRSELQRQVHFTVTLPKLDEVAVGGSGKVNIDQVDGPKLGVSFGGSGNLAIARLAVDSASFSIGGSGNVSAAGTARDLTVNVGGSGSFDAPQLRAQAATVATAGSGWVRTVVNGRAMVSTVGSGRIDLGPAAQCQIARRGNTQVRCGA